MTEGCPIPFVTRVLLPPEPQFVSASWTFAFSVVEISIVFDVPMNTTVTPADAKWDVEVDGMSRAVVFQSWTDEFTLMLELFAGGPPLTDVVLVWLTADPGLRSTFAKQVQPFGPIPIPEE